jgi:hypothetical protein
MAPGAAGLMVVAIVALFFCERTWLRIVCAAYLGLYALFVVHLLASGQVTLKYLAIPGTLALFALFVAGVKKTYGKW